MLDFCPSLRENDHQSPRIADLERLFKICLIFIKMNMPSVPLALLQAYPGLFVIKNKEGSNLFKAAIQFNADALLTFFSSLTKQQKQLLVEGWNTEPVLIFALRYE
jgi:hypothetical protein